MEISITIHRGTGLPWGCLLKVWRFRQCQSEFVVTSHQIRTTRPQSSEFRNISCKTFIPLLATGMFSISYLVLQKKKKNMDGRSPLLHWYVYNVEMKMIAFSSSTYVPASGVMARTLSHSLTLQNFRNNNRRTIRAWRPLFRLQSGKH
jgi:hypothetical protein